MPKIKAKITKIENRKQRNLKAKIQFFANINKIHQLLSSQPNSDTKPDEDFI